MKTNSKNMPAASEGNPAYPKLAEREALVKAAAREKPDVRKIPADDLKKADGKISPEQGGNKEGQMGRENPDD